MTDSTTGVANRLLPDTLHKNSGLFAPIHTTKRSLIRLPSTMIATGPRLPRPSADRSSTDTLIHLDCRLPEKRASHDSRIYSTLTGHVRDAAAQPP